MVMGWGVILFYLIATPIERPFILKVFLGREKLVFKNLNPMTINKMAAKNDRTLGISNDGVINL